MRAFQALIREALRAATAHRVASLATIALVSGMTAAVLLTAGRGAGAQLEVLATIDSVGSRSITVQADESAGLDTSALPVLDRIAGVESVIAFSPARDVENASFASERVSMRYAYGRARDELRAQQVVPDTVVAYPTDTARTRLGLSSSAGTLIRPDSGEVLSVAGLYSLPENLKQYEPLVVASAAIVGDADPIGLIVVVTTSPTHVKAVAEAVRSALYVDDPSKVRVASSERIADLRSSVEGQLAYSSREIVLVIYAVTAALVCVVLSTLIMLRRKDFGRRRALGASRRLIIALVLLQTAAPSVVGVTAGLALADAILLISALPVVPLQFAIAVAITSWATAVLGALIPAWLASRRDPLLELRVP